MPSSESSPQKLQKYEKELAWLWILGCLALYIEFLYKKNISINVNNTGLCISKTHPYLAASLDGLATNTETNYVWRIEIKCRSSKYLKSMTEVLADKPFYLYKDNNGSIKLKKTSILLSSSRSNVVCKFTNE